MLPRRVKKRIRQLQRAGVSVSLEHASRLEGEQRREALNEEKYRDE